MGEPVQVWFLEKAFDEAAGLGLDVDGLVAALISAVQKGLVRTGGSKFKALRGCIQREYRLRHGKIRIPCSLAYEQAGKQHIFVHQVGHRDQIYRSRQFRSRIQAFHQNVWDEKRQLPRVDLSEQLWYTVWSSPSPVLPSKDTVQAGPLLSEFQTRYLCC
jgi:hypothetical protein